MQITNFLEFCDTLDADNEMRVHLDSLSRMEWIDKQKAEDIIKHLQDVFELNV